MKPIAQLTDAEIVDAMAANPSYRTRREPKACPCGHIRAVTVSFVVQYGVESKHHWASHCGACQLEQRARHYESEARRFRLLASEKRASQQRTVQRRATRSA